MFKIYIMIILLLFNSTFFGAQRRNVRIELIRIALKNFHHHPDYLERIRAAETLAIKYRTEMAVNPFIDILANTSIADQTRQRRSDAVYQLRLRVAWLLSYYKSSPNRLKIINDLIRVIKLEKRIELLGVVCVTLSNLIKENYLKKKFIKWLIPRIRRLKTRDLTNRSFVINICKSAYNIQTTEAVSLLTQMMSLGFAPSIKRIIAKYRRKLLEVIN